MKRILLWTAVSAGGLVIVVSAFMYAFWHDMQTSLDRPVVLHEPRELFPIAKGESLAGIAERFEQAGWIKKALYLRLEARQLRIGSKIKAGLYEIRDGASPREMLDQFVRGDVKVFRITFIEGTTFEAMLETLSEHSNIAHTLDRFDPATRLARVAPNLTQAEGWFFPSTYNYLNGEEDVSILRRAHTRMLEILNAQWQDRAPDLPYKSEFDALIMASIIEKETGRADERAEIAGVFVRRLQRGMKLQTDPTVIYGLGDRFDGNLRRVDLEGDTPYNTYLRPGLPPTPIAMPGEASIEAALHPAPGDSLYFVGKGDGSHVFSKTLEQHNAAVRRYQLTAERDGG